MFALNNKYLELLANKELRYVQCTMYSVHIYINLIKKNNIGYRISFKGGHKGNGPPEPLLDSLLRIHNV